MVRSQQGPGGPSKILGARCARARRRAGFTGTRMATEPVLDTGFRTEAGTAAEGRLFATTYVDRPNCPPWHAS